MCLIAFALEAHPRYPLVFAANRDEFYERPTAPAAFWDDAPQVLAGRDLKAGGTWMGITRAGRFAAITNFREPGTYLEDAPSRGHLVGDYLRGDEPPEDYLEMLKQHGHRYNGFNLLFGTPRQLYYFSNRHASDGEKSSGWKLTPGVHGLSNHLLNTPWPKVEQAREDLRNILQTDEIPPEHLLVLLEDRTRAPEQKLPETGLPAGLERALSSIFIQTSQYGTRSSSAILVDRDDRVTFVERTYDAQGEPSDERAFEFVIETEAAS